MHYVKIQRWWRKQYAAVRQQHYMEDIAYINTMMHCGILTEQFNERKMTSLVHRCSRWDHSKSNPKRIVWKALVSIAWKRIRAQLTKEQRKKKLPPSRHDMGFPKWCCPGPGFMLQDYDTRPVLVDRIYEQGCEAYKLSYNLSASLR